MTTTPTEPLDPATRGPQIEVPAPSLGRCIDGISEYGFIVCTADENGVAVPVAPTGLPTTAEVGQSAPPLRSLPETGTDVSAPIFGAGLIAASLGIFLVGVARRR